MIKNVNGIQNLINKTISFLIIDNIPILDRNERQEGENEPIGLILCPGLNYQNQRAANGLFTAIRGSFCRCYNVPSPAKRSTSRQTLSDI